jgi:hypothetical protein
MRTFLVEGIPAFALSLSAKPRTNMRTRHLAAIAAILGVFLASSSANATRIESEAFGHQLAGGTVTVFFQFSPPSTATIVGNAATENGSAVGFALVPGPALVPAFSFNVTGDTFDATWSLTNLMADDFIRTINFDLSGSVSLFDNDGTPSTPDSSVGVQGVVPLAGPVPNFAVELAPWPDIQNLGDMFLEERIVFQIDPFGPGQVFEWHDDTDVIPEPSTLALFATGILLLVARCARRQRRFAVLTSR